MFEQDFDLAGEVNVFLVDEKGNIKRPVTDGLRGYKQVIDVSPDGTQLLVVSWDRQRDDLAHLYTLGMDGRAPVLLTSRLVLGFIDPNEQPAYWAAGGQNVFFIANEPDGANIFRVNPDGTNKMRLTESGSLPLALLPSGDLEWVYWVEGRGDVTYGYQRSSIDGGKQEELWEGLWRLSLAQRATALALQEYNPEVGVDPLPLVVSELHTGAAVELWTPESELQFLDDVVISPSGERLLLTVFDCAAANLPCEPDQAFVWDREIGQLKEVPFEVGEGVLFRWSPDESLIVFTQFVREDQLSVHIKVLDIRTGDVSLLMDPIRPAEGFGVGSLQWVP